MGWVLQEDRGLLLAQGSLRGAPRRCRRTQHQRVRPRHRPEDLHAHAQRRAHDPPQRPARAALRRPRRQGPAARHRRLRRRHQRPAAGGEEQGRAVHARRSVRLQRAGRPDLRRGRRRRGPQRPVPRRAARAPRQGRGADALRRPLRAFGRRHADDPHAQRSLRPRPAQAERQRDPRRRQPAAHAHRGRERARREHAHLGEQLPHGRPPALDHGPSAVRRRPPDRLLLPRPDARGRRALARPPGARRLLARAPGDDPDRPRRGLRVEPHLGRLGPDRRVRGDPLRRLVHPLPLSREVPQDGDGRRGHDRGRGAGPLPHDGPRSGDGLRHGRRQARRDRPQARELRPRRAVAAPVPRRHDRAHLRHALVRQGVRALAVHLQRRLRRRPRHRDVLRRRAPAPRPAGRPAAPDARHGRVRVARHAALTQAAAAGQPGRRRAAELEQQPRAGLRRGGRQLVLRLAAPRVAAPRARSPGATSTTSRR